jgi:hypothetical protein
MLSAGRVMQRGENVLRIPSRLLAPRKNEARSGRFRRPNPGISAGPESPVPKHQAFDFIGYFRGKICSENPSPDLVLKGVTR